MTKTFSISELQAYPSDVQKAIVKNHEDLNGEIDAILYSRDNKTVYFGVNNDWIAVVPKRKRV